MTTPRLQQDPAEGSRDIVERELARQSAKDRSAKGAKGGKHKPGNTVAAEDLKRLLGDIDDDKIVEILDLEPTIAEVEEAVAWCLGESDVMGSARKPLRGKAARIFEILNAGDEDEMYPPP